MSVDLEVLRDMIARLSLSKRPGAQLALEQILARYGHLLTSEVAS